LFAADVNTATDGASRAAEGAIWHSDYGTATQAARQSRQMLVIHFEGCATTGTARQFRDVLAAPSVQDSLARYTLLRLPVTAAVKVGGRSQRLLAHPAFSYMRCQPGLAMIDFTDPDSPHWNRVVTQMPFRSGRGLGQRETLVLLNLPGGSLTQRTLVYAVRIHPEVPQSTNGECCEMLMQEADSHAAHQARIGRQGHHNWERRFHSISARLRSGLLAQEVCAESWPGQDLVDAAVECVHSWRQSSGHWSAVRASHPRFGYDMRRGANGIWYATGIFGTRRY